MTVSDITEARTSLMGPNARAGLAWPYADRLPPLERIDGEPQFKLFVAGARASGKTVFLAALNNQIGVAGNESYFIARLTSSDLANDLQEKFYQISDASRDWPPGSSDATDYIFKCSRITPNGLFPLFRFHYTDFPGGNMTRPSAQQALDVRQAVQEAHTVIFLIDGEKILDAIENRVVEGHSLNGDLDIVANLATDCIHRPTQFVITKWDLLVRTYPLRRIRDFLLENEYFSGVIRTRREVRQPTYLIPVSAVGDTFAEIDPATKAMVKRPNASPRPYNLDITLALAITDTLLNSFKAPLTGRDQLLLNLLKMLVGTEAAIRWIARAGFMLTSDPWALAMMAALYKASKRIGRFVGDLRAEQDLRVAGITDKNWALDMVTQVQHLRVMDFLSRFPEADLLH